MRMVSSGLVSVPATFIIILKTGTITQFQPKIMEKILLTAALYLLSGSLVGQQLREDALPGETFYQYREGTLFKYAPEGKKIITNKEYISNGMTVFPDGSFIRSNEKKRRLKDGQYLDVNGKVFSTLADLQAQQESHKAAIAGEFYQLRNGEIIRHREKGIEAIRSEVLLKNGITLFPDGMFSTAEGKKYRLREGQCMDVTGKIFRDTQTLHLKSEKRINEGKN